MKILNQQNSLSKANADALSGSKGTASFAAPAQLYAIHKKDKDLNTTITTANQRYSLKDDSGNKEVYGRGIAAVPRNSKEVSEFLVNGVVVKEYVPSNKFLHDCLHTAEEIMHGHALEQGKTRSREVSSELAFGDGVLKNWQAARAAKENQSNRNANPGLGGAYVTTTRFAEDIGDGVRCQFHAAAVVAVDGSDHITLEIFGNPDEPNRDGDATYSIYNSAPDSGLTFHDNWINTFENGITISVEPIPEN
jgi:hypothetical protein